VFTNYEKHRLQTAGIEGDYSLYRWRAYFTYLLGRPVGLEETATFLKDEAERQKPSQEDQWSIALTT